MTGRVFIRIVAPQGPTSGWSSLDLLNEEEMDEVIEFLTIAIDNEKIGRLVLFDYENKKRRIIIPRDVLLNSIIELTKVYLDE